MNIYTFIVYENGNEVDRFNIPAASLEEATAQLKIVVKK